MKGIEISYQRTPNRNMLIFTPQEDIKQTILTMHRYELGMMEYNTISSFLHLEIKRDEGGFSMAFDISSRQPLSRVAEVAPMGVRELKNVISGILGAARALEEYLLDPVYILLNPDYIYCDLDTSKLFFCYIPGNAQTSLESIPALFEVLLGYIQKEDKDALLYAYQVYQECQKKGFVLGDLLHFMQKQVKSPEERLEDFSPSEVMREENGEKAPEKKKGRNFRFFESLFKKENPREEDWNNYEGEVEAVIEEERPEESVFEKPLQPVSHTVLLSQEPESAASGLVLKSLDMGEDIAVPYFPFVIGKQERVCDYLLNAEGISRMHLKIDKFGEEILVKDLNSRNGVMVSGKLLENEDSCQVKEGDVIQICARSYQVALA